MHYRANHKRVKKLPAIFPIVLYNGKRKWSAPAKISYLIEDEPPLDEYAIQFQDLLLNEKTYRKEQLLKIRNIVSTLFLAEGHYDIALLKQELLSLYEQEAYSSQDISKLYEAQTEAQTEAKAGRLHQQSQLDFIDKCVTTLQAAVDRLTAFMDKVLRAQKKRAMATQTKTDQP